ncbi:MAG: hypothetical protein SGJ09_17490 [Phycisphaerae bacterium]|nr:hypothetical protein [Phycisphaerae bacterium]
MISPAMNAVRADSGFAKTARMAATIGEAVDRALGRIRVALAETLRT